MSAPLAIDICIVFRSWDSWVDSCLHHSLRLKTPAAHIWLVPDDSLPVDLQNTFAPHVIVRPSGRLNAASKRNLVLDASTADIIACIDADARPHPDWLDTAVDYFQNDPDLILLGGPNLTPPEDTPSMQAVGNALASPLGNGGAAYCYSIASPRQNCELPSCNILIRRHPDFRFQSNLPTAEDVTFCKSILRAGRHTRYAPEIRIFHHRRALVRPFARQTYNWGLGEGRLSHPLLHWRNIPALFLLYLLALPFALAFAPLPPHLLLAPLCLYLLLVLKETIRLAQTPLIFILTLAAFPLATLSYAVGFIIGRINPHTELLTTSINRPPK